MGGLRLGRGLHLVSNYHLLLGVRATFTNHVISLPIVDWVVASLTESIMNPEYESWSSPPTVCGRETWAFSIL